MLKNALIMWLLGLGLSVGFSSKRLLAGPVQPPGSKAWASMNAQADYLLAGPWKVRLQWRGQNRAFFPTEGPWDSQQLPTGGIADRDAGAPHLAIVCNQQTVQLIKRGEDDADLSRQPFFPWQPPISGKKSPNYQCAMNRDGQFAILDQANHRIWLSDREVVIPQQLLNSSWWNQVQVAATDDSFWFLGANGRLYSIDGTGTLQSIEDQRFVIYENFYWTGRGQYLGFASAEDVILLKTSEDGRIEQRFLPSLAPCDDRQDCVLSMASDGSWLLVGYWGAYGGRFGQSQRLSLHLETGRQGASALAHSGMSGSGDRFVFSGAFDGDEGAVQALFRRPKYPLTATERWQPAPIAADPFWRRDAQAWWYPALDLIRPASLAPEDVVVAVIDSGLGADHQELDFPLWVNASEVPDNGRDDDQNGLIDDAHGFDFVLENKAMVDKHGHGTHVAGLLASRYKDGESFSIANNVKLMVLRALDQSGRSYSIDLARAIRYAVNAGAELINCSWGGGGYSIALEEAFEYAASRGVVVITSVGNDGLDHDRSPQLPANYPAVYTVGAFDQQGRRASFSNYGAGSVQWFAPGADILSSLNTGDLGEMSGTSMAAPMVTSSMALVLGYLKADPKHQQLSLKERLSLATQLLCDWSKPDSRLVSRCGRLWLSPLGGYFK